MASEKTPSKDIRDDVVPPADIEQQVQASSSSPVVPDASLQQASAHQGGGGQGAVPAEQIKKPSEVNRDDPNINVVDLPPHSPTFKEQVYGYARLIRGTVLGRSDVKEQGTQVLRGEQGIPPRRGSQSSK